ncbi:MAG: LamG domain-containing protein, partial [Phycisphaerales bacterium]
MFKKLIFLACLVLGLLGNASADLIVHWTLEEGSGTTATDVSGNSRDGTFTGEPQWVSGHNSAGALHFDGVDDFVVYSLDGAQNFATISVALWVKADTLGQPVYCSPFSAHYPNTAGFQVDVDGQNPGAYRINPNSGNRFAFGPVTTDWIHLALTIEGSSMNLYYNGNWASSNTLVDTDLTFNQFAIGVNRNRNWWFAGTIDDLRVYDHVLSEVEVVSIMEGKPWPFASSPKPEDASMLEATWASLSWQPGQLAVSHDLYFGTNFDDVNAGAEGTFVGNLATTQQVVGFPGFPAPEGLQPGTIYYWRVDEVNHADPNSPWKGNIWSFAVPPRIAYDPRPSDGAKFADPNVELTWTPGFDAKLHTAYFGDNFDDVNGATGGIPLADATYVPGTLELEKVYYWRVDEFDGAQTHKGDVW